jgi:hypothetical protein
MTQKSQNTLTPAEQEMNDAIDDAEAGVTVEVTEDPKEAATLNQTAVAVASQRRELAGPMRGFNIEGLQDVDVSILAVPFVRLVQPTSKKIELTNGKDAEVGSYYFNDLQEAYASLDFVMLRAKQQVKEFDREVTDEKGQKKTIKVPTRQLAVLAINLEKKKLFVLTLSISSFSNFGRLIAKFKDQKISAVWEYELEAFSAKKENDKGKFYVADFKIGRKLSEEELEEMAQIYGEYGGVLEREDIPAADET